MKFSTALSFALLLPALHQVAASPHNMARQNGGKAKPSSVALPSSTTIQASPANTVPPNANKNGGNRNGGNRNGGNNNPGDNTGNNNPGNNTGNNNPGNNTGNNNPGNNTGNNNGGNDNPGNNPGNNNNGDPQSSPILDLSLVGPNIDQDGQNPPVAGQVASLTSKNNFINYCLGKKISNGLQAKDGSCNPIPMGDIPSSDNMPSSKFTEPGNLQTIKASSTFTVKMAINKFVSGNFVNAQKNYYSAPQQLQGGLIKGHSHVVIQALTALEQTTPIDPTKFEFFKGLNDAAQNGILSTEVPGGLPPGAYRMFSIHGAANHQPVLVPIAQRGPVDDCVYFETTVDGKPSNSNNGGDNGGPKNGAVNPSPSSPAPSSGAGNSGGNNGSPRSDTPSPSSSSPAPSLPAGGGRNGGGNNGSPRNDAPSPSSSSPAPSLPAGGGRNGGGNNGSPKDGASNPSLTPSSSPGPSPSPSSAGGGGKNDGKNGRGGR